MSADRWTHHDAGVRDIIARETAALTAENEALRARLAKVEALHAPVDIHQYDSENGVWILDSDGEKVLLARICRECSDEEVLGAIEDCEWREGWHSGEIEWPCPTVAALAEGGPR